MRAAAVFKGSRAGEREAGRIAPADQPRVKRAVQIKRTVAGAVFVHPCHGVTGCDRQIGGVEGKVRNRDGMRRLRLRGGGGKGRQRGRSGSGAQEGATGL